MSQRIAFIMSSNGSENYDQLKYANDDAKRIAEVLRQEEYGFQTSEVPKDKKNRRYSILDYLSTVIETCTEQDYFIFYFSGHGEVRYGQLHLILDETDFKNQNSYDNTALPIADVLKKIDHCAAKNKLIILDCCHGGAIGNGYKSSDPKENSKFEEIIDNSESSLILLASDKLERTCEVEIELPEKSEPLKGGFLTLKLYVALTNKPDEVYDDRGYISIDKINTWLQTETEQYNKKKPHLKPIPTPFIKVSKVKGNFFRFNPIPINYKNTQPTLEQLLKEAQLEEITKLKLELKDSQDARQREQMELQLLQSQLRSKDEIIAIYKQYNSQLKEQNSELNERLAVAQEHTSKLILNKGNFNISPVPESVLGEKTTYNFYGYNINGNGDTFIGNDGEVTGTKHNYAPPRNLAEAAEEIQQLLQKLEKTNPTPTEKQQVDYINAATSSQVKKRLVKVLKEADQQELTEAINPTIFNIIQALMRLNQDTNENEN